MARFPKFLCQLGLVFLSVCQSQGAPPPGTSEDGPSVEVTGFAWSENQLVVGLKVTASRSEPLAFGFDETAKGGAAKLFTTKESWLIDLHSGKKIAASKKYPKGPNMGWVRLCDILAPGGSENFTAAFPPPPLPPVVNGKRQDYHLELHLPGNLPPVVFKVPVAETAAAAP